MLTLRAAPLEVVVLPEAVPLPVEAVEPLELPDAALLDVVPPDLEPPAGAPLETEMPEPPDVELPEVDPLVPDPSPPVRSLVTTNASAAKDTCLGLNKAIWPLAAPLGTVTCASLSLTTCTATLRVVPNQAVSRPVKPVPCIVTTVPAGPLNGKKPMMYGCGIAAVLPLEGVLPLDAVPALDDAVVLPPECVAVLLDFVTENEFGETAEWIALSTATWPLVASFGTVTWTLESLSTCTPASRVLPIHAASSPVKPEPCTVMTVPTTPDVGANDCM